MTRDGNEVDSVTLSFILSTVILLLNHCLSLWLLIDCREQEFKLNLQILHSIFVVSTDHEFAYILFLYSSQHNEQN